MPPKRTVLTDILKGAQSRLEAAAEEPVAKPKGRAAPKVAVEPAKKPETAAKEPPVKQTVYLPPPVHDQLRDLAHAERVRMHAILMEGLDAVFRKRGLKSIDTLLKG